MSRSRRIVAVLYCLLVAYCSLWVPWHMGQGEAYERIGYGWLWIGPPLPNHGAIICAPDIPIITLRFIAVTAICGAAYIASRQRP